MCVCVCCSCCWALRTLFRWCLCAVCVPYWFTLLDASLPPSFRPIYPVRCFTNCHIRLWHQQQTLPKDIHKTSHTLISECLSFIHTHTNSTAYEYECVCQSFCWRWWAAAAVTCCCGPSSAVCCCCPKILSSSRSVTPSTVRSICCCPFLSIHQTPDYEQKVDRH